MIKRVLNKYYIIFLFSFLFIVSGCKVKRPDYVIPEAKMEQVLYDYHLAKAMGDNLPYNENYKKVLYLESVFDKHGITEAEFDTSLVWYTRNTEVLYNIYERVNERFKSQQDEINTLISIRDNKPKISQPGDSIDVWVWERIYRLSDAPLTNKMSFVLPSDTNFKSRDTLVWQANYSYFPVDPDSLSAAIMTMQIRYLNDSIISEDKKITESGVHQLTLQGDTLGEIKEIRGFVYYPMQTDSIKTLIMDDISLYRYHSLDSIQQPTDSIANTAP